MKSLTKAWHEILQGENIDLYLTVAAAFVVGILSFFGNASNNLITSVTLALLGLIAIANLKNRHEFAASIKSIVELKGNARASDFFILDKRISDQSFASANHSFIAGMTLSRTTREYMYILGQRLIAGANIRIIILDPTNDELLQQLTLRSAGNTTVEYWRSRLQTVQTVIKVIRETPNAKGTLEIGYLPYIPSFGFVMTDPDDPNALCYVEMYHHKSAKLNPTF